LQKKIKLIDKFKIIGSSSQFHESIRQILLSDSYFKNLKCYQEVPVIYLVKEYQYSNHHIDWYIEELRTVIELHGKQHYKRTNFGNKPYLESVKDFNNIKYRDNLKKTAILNAGYEYIEIPYTLAKKINPKMLKEIIFKIEQK
jgi:hypothetical protein